MYKFDFFGQDGQKQYREYVSQNFQALPGTLGKI